MIVTNYQINHYHSYKIQNTKYPNTKPPNLQFTKYVPKSESNQMNHYENVTNVQTYQISNSITIKCYATIPATIDDYYRTPPNYY